MPLRTTLIAVAVVIASATVTAPRSLQASSGCCAPQCGASNVCVESCAGVPPVATTCSCCVAPASPSRSLSPTRSATRSLTSSVTPSRSFTSSVTPTLSFSSSTSPSLSYTETVPPQPSMSSSRAPANIQLPASATASPYPSGCCISQCGGADKVSSGNCGFGVNQCVCGDGSSASGGERAALAGTVFIAIIVVVAVVAIASIAGCVLCVVCCNRRPRPLSPSGADSESRLQENPLQRSRAVADHASDSNLNNLK